MDSWTLQTGYPVVTVSRDYETGTAKVTQNRFLLEKEEARNVSSEPLWKIPITYTHSRNSDWENTTTKLWLHSATGTLRDLPGPNDWLILNIQEVGYYRVNYDIHNWKLVINQLEKDHKVIHVVNRAQLMDDAMDLARAGLLPYDLALMTTLYINKERNYLPWEAALESLSYIDMMLSRSAIYGKWEKYVLRQLSSMYNELGWEEDETESILIQYNRINSLGWTCKHGHPQCVKIAKRKFQEWKDNYNDLTIIPPNLRSVVYCTAIQYGGQEAWDFTWQRYLEEEVASERDKLMRALACAREPWLLSRYLEWSLNQSSGIKRQDGTYVFRSVASNIYGRDIAFNYLREKWDILLDIYGKSFFSLGSLVQTVTSSLNTQFELDQLVKFYENHKDKLGTAHRSFKQAIEKARANVHWMNKNFEIIASWLDNISL
ncbi:aminopeptidase N-like [Limulus polyphemus]|uniref:Aminopeptidase N-like n=1 Tax=Limulus polyphemus TaxID=6850 RepID=A0ABM1BXD6_LIMPO|nr:aminopeptidase N-like [Limulus polyphemus]